MNDIYNFKNKELLREALTHSSFANENKIKKNNERLELLGDAVLSLTITDLLLKLYPNDREGEISQKRDQLVNENRLYDIAKNFEIEKVIYFGKGEELSGGREKKRLVASAFEAIIGAIYMDSNLETTKEVIETLFKNELISVKSESGKINYKDKLQQFCYRQKLDDPEYRVTKTEGPDHKKIFFVDILIDDKKIVSGKGSTKKQAEQDAARLSIKKLES